MWSVRDYSNPGSVVLRYASDFRDVSGRIALASDVRAAAEYDFAAPIHPTPDLDHWHAAIHAKNSEFLVQAPETQSVTAPIRQPSGSAMKPSFPILNLPKLLASAKARKRGDIELERILHSENSEDYVTWIFFNCSN
jgi:hypothetical protein